MSIDINTDDGLAVEIESSINQAHAGDSLISILGVGIPYMGMLLPIIIVFIALYFSAKEKKDRKLKLTFDTSDMTNSIKLVQ